MDYKQSYLVGGVRFDVDPTYELESSILLGEGSFGSVCKARVRSADGTGKYVAVKKIKNVFENLIDAKRTLRELRILGTFRHENIINLLDIMTIPNVEGFKECYLVTDLMDTDLHNIIVSKNALTNDHCKYFVYQILRALKYIHSAGVLHRDLKPSNVLINANSDIKICDFGLARTIDMDGVFYTSYVATRWYRAPEIILEKGQYSKAVDVWSVGCILAEILLRRPLFPGRDTVHQLSLIVDVVGNFSEEQISKTKNERARRYMRKMRRRKKKPFARLFPQSDSNAVDLCELLLHPDPDYRLPVNDAIQHPYLEQLHMPDDEPECSDTLDFSFEGAPLTEPVLRDLIYNEMLRFHPEMGDHVANKLWDEGATPTDMELQQYGDADLATAMLEAGEILSGSDTEDDLADMDDHPTTSGA